MMSRGSLMRVQQHWRIRPCRGSPQLSPHDWTICLPRVCSIDAPPNPGPKGQHRQEFRMVYHRKKGFTSEPVEQ